MEKHVVNPCKTCAPLGASLAMKGIRKSMCILHGSQGCATYIRRFFIGHFREPVDIASSSFDESTAVFGGRENLIRGIRNVIQKYEPDVIGIATSCLAETIGEDIGMYMKDIESINNELPAEGQGLTFIHTDTAAYKGTHLNGFMKMTAAAAALAERPADEAAGVVLQDNAGQLKLNIIPWMVSPGDIRFLKRMMKDMDINATFLPDYSLTLDGGNWTEYEAIPEGGTSLEEIKAMGAAGHTVQFGDISVGASASAESSPAFVIEQNTGVSYSVLPLPIGLKNTDRFINRLLSIAEELGSRIKLTDEMKAERGRLLDAYADVHKYCMGRTAAVYGEADFVSSMAAFLCELGIEPLVVMTGEKISAEAGKQIRASIRHYGFSNTEILSDSDFSNLDDFFSSAAKLPDLMIGNSKGYKTARAFNIPLVRAGFPVQDRFGSQRLLHLGYEGALRMLDEIANTLISKQQAESPVGYMSM